MGPKTSNWVAVREFSLNFLIGEPDLLLYVPAQGCASHYAGNLKQEAPNPKFIQGVRFRGSSLGVLGFRSRVKEHP